ncbi:MAG: hypothetical protein WC551_02875 [Patescibacteria group bacterium]
MKTKKTYTAFGLLVTLLLSFFVPFFAIGFLAFPCAIFFRLQGNTTMFAMTIVVAAILIVGLPIVNFLAIVGYDDLKNR